MLQIRKARQDDVPLVALLIQKVVPLMRAEGNYQWDDRYPTQETFTEDVQIGQLWVALLDNTLCGVTAITTDQNPEYAEAGLDVSIKAIVPHRMAVHPDFRGKGVAKALMIEAEHEAKRNGVKFVRVDTNKNNKATQSLFPKLGYRFCGEVNFPLYPGQVFLCYEKKVE
eukprot:TRINITY_DN17738_c0_g1_i1.p1 TRINITY_DN17738_c0_g1~~TRINITY_DN17738_c0_g1_i1.p1  ORF type:complete len:169 (-),score=23.88 TRINITY_DN17738_c0_g1_i1:201-707(-)